MRRGISPTFLEVLDDEVKRKRSSGQSRASSKGRIGVFAASLFLTLTLVRPVCWQISSTTGSSLAVCFPLSFVNIRNAKKINLCAVTEMNWRSQLSHTVYWTVPTVNHIDGSRGQQRIIFLMLESTCSSTISIYIIRNSIIFEIDESREIWTKWRYVTF